VTNLEVPAVELIDVHTAFDDTWVLRGVNFAAPRGRITVLVGPSGVGKTTCIRHITGLLFPDMGDVLVDGQSRGQMRKPEHAALARRFGVLLQGSGIYGSALFASMTVLENVMFQLRAVTGRPEEELRERALERLKEVGLADHADAMPAVLSAGMSKRVALARALAADPDFAVLDSIDDGVDPVRLGRLCDLIRAHHEKLGGTYIITTHDMDVARRLADHVVVLWDGRVVEEGPADQVFGSNSAEVRQFVTGDVTGPLALRSDPGAGQAYRPRPPGEAGIYIPIPLAIGVTLAVITGSVLVLGNGNPWEVVVLVLVWAAAAVFVTVRFVRTR